MKKFLIVLFVFLMVFGSLLFGRGATEATSDGTIKEDLTIYTHVAVGGALDVRARVVAEYLAKELGVNVSVENITGAGGATAATQLLTGSNSPYDLFFAACSVFTSIPVFTETIYSIDDYIPLTAVDVESFGLYVSPKRSGLKSFDDLKNYAKTKEVIFGSGGTGNVTHLYQAGLYNLLGFKANTLAHNGAVVGLTNNMGGHNVVTMAGLETARSYVKSGDVVPIMTFSDTAYTGYEGYTVPSVLEVGGNEECVYESLMLIACLASVDDAHAKTLQTALKNVLANPECIAALKKVGLNHTPDMSIAELREYVVNEKKVIENILAMISK